MKQFAIIGIGRFGSSIAKALYSMGYDVLAIDTEDENIQTISEYTTHAVQADATDESVLKALGIRNFDVVIITIGNNIQSSIMIALLCKELGVKQIIAKAQNDLHARVLRKIGVNKVVFPERDMGERLARNLVSSNIVDFIEVAPDYSMVEITPKTEWAGKILDNLNLRERFGVNVMAIKHADGSINISPRANDKIKLKDKLIVIGSNKDIRRLESREKLSKNNGK